MEMTQFVTHDLSRLDDLSLDAIQKCLKDRYERDLIYTNISDILVAINPRKTLNIYDASSYQEYGVGNFSLEAKPHIFQVAATAYKRMRETDTNQVIIVSGESGSGKTESTKYMVKHVVHMCQGGDMDLHEKIVKINPLLEAFGNAKTIMNENSSRYAKYLELSFKEDGVLAGAVVRDYMLEKSRVVHQSSGEGIFHIFYALFAGCPREVKEDLFLIDSPDHYRIMQSDAQSLSDTERYRKMYIESMDILQKIGVNREILQAMLAAVILIAEIEFEEDDRGAAQIADAVPFAHAAILLGLDEISFGEALIASKRMVRNEMVASHKTLKQANDGRDALAKMLYERMFGWLVRMINQDLHPNRLGTNIAASIGILDIAGFEKLQNNSFEQLCINLVNEKLQSFMNRKIFTMEIEIYKEEGIHLDGINFTNNDALLEMFEKPRVGLLAILDENSNMGHGSDKGFVDHLKTSHGKNPLFVQPPGDHPMFCIQHFAALVPYNADGIIEKNRDRLNDELVEVMRNSKDEFIADLFTIKRGPTGTISMDPSFMFRASRRGVQVMPPGKLKPLRPTPQGEALARELGKSLKKKFGKIERPSEMTQIAPTKEHKTLVSYFRSSLLDLLEKLGHGEPFFVRCIKANASMRADCFDDVVVGDQLKYNGLAEIAKIRKMGYDVRMTYRDFFTRFRGLFKRVPSMTQSEVNTSLISTIRQDYHRDFRCGKSRVFMTGQLKDWLEKVLLRREVAASYVVTRCMRRVVEFKKHQRWLEKERKRIEREEEEKRRREEDERLAALGRSVNKLGTTVKLGATGQPSPFKASFKASVRSTTGGQESPGPSQSSSTGSSTTGDYDTPDGLGGGAGGGGFGLGETWKPDGRFGAERPPSPVVHIDKNHDIPVEDTTKEVKKTETAFWDVCQIISRERKTRDVDEDRGLQVIKVVAYILLFCILLWCAVAQKISLMVLVSLQYNRTADRKVSERDEDAKVEAARHILVTIAILIPYCLIFLSSVFKWMFGNFPAPNFSTLVVSMIVEILHAIGICILVFLVLPEVGTVRGIFLMNGVAIIPAVLFAFCASDVKISRSLRAKTTKPSAWKRIGIFVLNMLTIVLQFGYIPFILLLNHAVKDSFLDNATYDIVLFVVAMFFISFSWWENFTDDRFCGPTNNRGCWKTLILKTKFDLQEARPVITACTSFVKIGFIFLFSWLFKEFHPSNVEEGKYENLKGPHQPNNTRYIHNVRFGEAFEAFSQQPFSEMSSILTLTLTSFVGYYVGYTACKLKLQRFSFNIPLILSTPLAVLITALDCPDQDVLYPFTRERRECNVGTSVTEDVYHYVVGFAVWASMYWLCRHIFYPNIERLAKTERLFMNPFYCGILFEQSMLLNRRRHTRKVYKELKDKVTYRLSEYNSKVNIEGEEEAEDDGDTEKKKDGNNPDEDVYDDKYQNPKFRDIPTIYACATMWHETKYEMIQLMKSLFRMDRDQCVRRNAEAIFQKEDKDFYEFEAHILFDDAMVMNDDEEWIPNDFVKLLMTIMDEAASGVYERHMKIKPPFKVPTPYGGQLIFTMPGENFMFIHLKDKNKIRHRKRWSQVMYMYYLLGFRIVRMCQETVSEALNQGRINELLGWDEAQANGGIGRSHIFRAFDDQVLKKASNTFLLALDGDVDFSPGAVRLLLDRMRKSEKVGAACGRIHPIGTGPVVWFQKFEYAIAHWLQKATEHVLGCVLCSPGCFSMFRGSALMDDNIMKKYTILPTEATHHLMYDQGEDRWLCTLLLQQGYRVDYAAGSDAFTYAPEGFAEFFNQRRRWMPSTVFNIIDLLADYKNTVYINSNISMLYIFYQGALLLSTIVGPATVLLMIAGANVVVFKVDLIWGYVIALAPAVIYFIVCLYCKSNVQIQVAEIFTGLYSFVMMIVMVGTAVTAAEESPFHPSVVFLVLLVVSFAFAAFLHPQEWTNIINGALYFLLIPTGFLLLNIYSLCNLHVVSWGTREVPKKKTKEEIEREKKEAEEKQKKKKERGFFGRFFPSAPLKEIKDIISKITESQVVKKDMDSSETTKLLKDMNENLKEISLKLSKAEDAKAISLDSRSIDRNQDTDETEPKIIADETKTEKTETRLKSILKSSRSAHHTERRVSVGISDSVKNIVDDTEEPIYDKVKKERDELKNPAWLECKELGSGKVIPLADEEMKFWKCFIKKYLEPLELTNEQKKATAKELIDLRNNIALGMAVINLLWIAINFMFQFTSPTKVTLPFLRGGALARTSSDSPENLEENQQKDIYTDPADNIVKVDILGLLFIFFYLAILILQFIGMLMHRWGTFLHLVSVTKLKNPIPFKMIERNSNIGQAKDDIKPEDARKIIDAMLNEPLPDYSDDSDEDEFENDVRTEIETLQKTGSRFRMTLTPNGIGATSRRLGQTDTEMLRRSRAFMSQSARFIRNNIAATLSRSRNVHAPDGDRLRNEVQMEYFRNMDRNVDRPLPPPPVVKKRLRLNTGPGRMGLVEQLRRGNSSRLSFLTDSSPTANGGPLIEEESDDAIYETIATKGTVGRQIGKRLKLYAKSQGALTREHRVDFANSGRPTSTIY